MSQIAGSPYTSASTAFLSPTITNFARPSCPSPAPRCGRPADLGNTRLSQPSGICGFSVCPSLLEAPAPLGLPGFRSGIQLPTLFLSSEDFRNAPLQHLRPHVVLLTTCIPFAGGLYRSFYVEGTCLDVFCVAEAPCLRLGSL